MASLLLTGFLPERDDLGNASRDLVTLLSESGLPPGWVTALLPQDSAALPALLGALLAEHQPRLTILCGQAPGRNRLSLEAIALNVLDFRVPDAVGVQPRDTPASPGQPFALRSRLPLAAAASHLQTLGFPSHVSWHAGTFLCNQALYLTLDWLAHHGEPGQDALFLHIPLAPSQVILEASMAEKACLDTPFVASATRALGAWLLEQQASGN